uniref:U2A'/phosphoprotein 32 family A C-terminal domain-containing protein n=1 Tax=Phytophthora ramorum TaxID=164328 RepID=H3H2M3_PHYRM
MPLETLTPELARQIAADYPSLQSLNLSNNALRDVCHLQLLPCSLTQLDLGANRLATLPLELGIWLPELRLLRVRSNALESLRPLTGCLQLQTLDAGDNRVALVSELRFLESLGQLRQLLLDGNPVAEAATYRREVLAMLPQLQSLDGQEVTAAERLYAKLQLKTQLGGGAMLSKDLSPSPTRLLTPESLRTQINTSGPETRETLLKNRVEALEGILAVQDKTMRHTLARFGERHPNPQLSVAASNDSGAVPTEYRQQEAQTNDELARCEEKIELWQQHAADFEAQRDLEVVATRQAEDRRVQANSKAVQAVLLQALRRGDPGVLSVVGGPKKLSKLVTHVEAAIQQEGEALSNKRRKERRALQTLTHADLVQQNAVLLADRERLRRLVARDAHDLRDRVRGVRREWEVKTGELAHQKDLLQCKLDEQTEELHHTQKQQEAAEAARDEALLEVQRLREQLSAQTQEFEQHKKKLDAEGVERLQHEQEIWQTEVQDVRLAHSLLQADHSKQQVRIRQLERDLSRQKEALLAHETERGGGCFRMPLETLTPELARQIAADYPSLQSLNLSNNALRDVCHLQLLPCSLTQLDLGANRLATLPLELGIWLPELRLLRVRSNALESLRPLTGCLQLQTLDAGDNRVALVSELRFLESLGQLRQLLLDGNPVAEAATYRREVLAMLPQLQSLDGQEVTAAERLYAKLQLKTQLGGGAMLSKDLSPSPTRLLTPESLRTQINTSGPETRETLLKNRVEALEGILAVQDKTMRHTLARFGERHPNPQLSVAASNDSGAVPTEYRQQEAQTNDELARCEEKIELWQQHAADFEAQRDLEVVATRQAEDRRVQANSKAVQAVLLQALRRGDPGVLSVVGGPKKLSKLVTHVEAAILKSNGLPSWPFTTSGSTGEPTEQEGEALSNKRRKERRALQTLTHADLVQQNAVLLADRERLRRLVARDAHDLRDRVRGVRREWEVKTGELAHQKDLLQCKLDEQTEELHHTQKQQEAAEAARDEALLEVQRLREQLSAQTQEFEQHKKKLDAEGVERLQHEQEIWQTEVQDVRLAHSLLQADHSKQQVRIRQLERDLSRQKEALLAHETERVASLEEKVHRRDTELARLRRERNTILSSLREQERKLAEASAPAEATPTETISTQTEETPPLKQRALASQTTPAAGGAKYERGEGRMSINEISAPNSLDGDHEVDSSINHRGVKPPRPISAASTRLSPEDVNLRLQKLQSLTESLLAD